MQMKYLLNILLLVLCVNCVDSELSTKNTDLEIIN